MADDIIRDDDDIEDEEDLEEEVEVEEEEQKRPRESRPSGGQRRSYDRGGGGRSGGYRRPGQYQPRRRVCAFCADRVKVIDWKDVDLLRRFVSDNGDMRPRRKTGTCAKHQRRLAKAIKRARLIALLPYTTEHVRLSGMGRH